MSLLVRGLLALAPEPVEALAVDWEAPSSCVDADQAAARLQQLLPEVAPPVGGDVEADLRADVAIVRSDVGFRATVRFEGPQGHDERSFEDASCSIVADAALLVIAVSVDPVAMGEDLDLVAPSIQRPRTLVAEPEPASEPSPEREPGPIISTLAPRVEEPALPVEPPARRERPEQIVRAALGIVGGGGYGPLTLGQGQLGGELSVFGPWWRATLRGLWLAPRTVASEDNRAARYDGFTVGALGCGVPRAGARSQIEFPLCGGLEAGLLRGEGTGGTPDPRRGSRPTVALLVGPGLRWAVRERLALVLHVELMAPLLRGGFTIDGAIVSATTPVGVRGLWGLEVRLP